MNYHKFAKIYSYSRISRYLKAAKGNKNKAQAMYYANARLARSFQPLISFFEVILRNHLHYALASHFGDVQWLINQKTGFMSAPSLTHANKKIICDFMAWINPGILVEIGKENLDQVKSDILATETILNRM